MTSRDVTFAANQRISVYISAWMHFKGIVPLFWYDVTTAANQWIRLYINQASNWVIISIAVNKPWRIYCDEWGLANRKRTRRAAHRSRLGNLLPSLRSTPCHLWRLNRFAQQTTASAVHCPTSDIFTGTGTGTGRFLVHPHRPSTGRFFPPHRYYF